MRLTAAALAAHQAKHQIFLDGQAGKDSAILGNDGHARTIHGIGRMPGQRLAIQRDGTVCRAQPPGDGFEKRRLPDAVASEQADNLAGICREADTLQDMGKSVMCMQLINFKHISHPCPK